MSGRKGETSYKETAFGILPRSRLIPLEIEGIGRAWNFVLHKVNRRTQITPEFLKEIHRVGFAWILPDVGGRFRKVEVEVSRHHPAVFYRVPQLMKDFCDDLCVRLQHLPAISHDLFLVSLIGLLAWAHHRFLWIHPFLDYNGRLARLLNNIILLKLNLPPIELQVETKRKRAAYVKALQEADRGNMKPLEGLVERAIVEAVQELTK